MNVIERIRAICKDRKIPISRLEKDCGFSNGYIRSLKEGKIPADRLATISTYLDEDFDYLLTGERKIFYEYDLRDKKLLSIIDRYNNLNDRARDRLLAYAEGLCDMSKEGELK